MSLAILLTPFGPPLLACKSSQQRRHATRRPVSVRRNLGEWRKNARDYSVSTLFDSDYRRQILTQFPESNKGLGANKKQQPKSLRISAGHTSNPVVSQATVQPCFLQSVQHDCLHTRSRTYGTW